jgi:hypothetical protein
MAASPKGGFALRCHATRKVIMRFLIFNLPTHPTLAVAGVSDFFNRMMGAILLAFQAAGAAIKIDPGLFLFLFPKDGLHAAFCFNQARLTIVAILREY